MPISLPMFFTLLLSACMLWVVVSDAARYVIPNTLNALIVGLFVIAAITLPLAPLPALGTAAIVLVVGLGMFALGLMGGGDIKLLVALSLWTGWSIATAQFIFATAICGGILVLIIVPLRLIAAKTYPTKTLPRLLTRKQPVPYGLAIAAAFSWLLWMDGVPGLTP